MAMGFPLGSGKMRGCYLAIPFFRGRVSGRHRLSLSGRLRV